MDAPLADRQCAVCGPGTPPLPAGRAEAMLGELRGWLIEEAGSHARLVKAFRFKGFMPGVELVNLIAELAEAEGHHPDLVLAYGSLIVQLWTHAAGGLTDNDFILAAKIDRLVDGGSRQPAHQAI